MMKVKSHDDRILDTIQALLEILKDEIPEIGGAAMTHLLASHTQDTREFWLEKMGTAWDLHHTEKNEST